MNREIKFRVWNNKSERFLPINEDSDYLISPSEVGLILIDNGNSVNSNDLVWLQFTGLLDKNGKEIYEGDVLIDNVADRKWEVFWHDGCFAYKHYVERKGFDGRIGPVITRCQSYLMKMCEAIGNIYENPELIIT